MKRSLILGLGLLLLGCDTTGVETDNGTTVDVPDTQQENDVNVLDTQQEVQDDKELGNGIKIKWFEHGDGASIAEGDCLEIDYKVQLADGKVVDGNHLLNKESLPFVVGYGMQTEGWDIALQEMKVGDFAEIFIPSELARGEKGIKDLIPPNADNVLRIRVLGKTKPTREVDGNKVWLFEENEVMDTKFDETNTIQFHCMVSTKTNPMYVNTFRDNNPFTLRLEDDGLVPGLKKALINAKKSDRMFILVPSDQAYGSKGYQDIVKPGEDILYNVLVMDVLNK